MHEMGNMWIWAVVLFIFFFLILLAVAGTGSCGGYYGGAPTIIVVDPSAVRQLSATQQATA